MDKKFGLFFPGQGAQSVGMGKQLYESHAAARRVYDRASDLLGKDISKLCFEGPENELQTTANSQPAIFVTSMATLNVIAEVVNGGPVGDEEREIFSPEDIQKFGSVALGLSLGEPAALVASGAMSFEEGLRFVESRGKFMEEASKANEGKMASIIGLDLEKVEELCKGIGCQVANLNCPGQVVISGHAGKVELAADLAKTQGAKKVIILKVSGAFHSELMLPAKRRLVTILNDIEIKEPSIDFISNLDGEVTRDPEKIRTNLADQLDNRTLWEDSVKRAAAMGVQDYLEIGPGSVLKGLARKIDPSLTVVPIHSLEEAKEILSVKFSLRK